PLARGALVGRHLRRGIRGELEDVFRQARLEPVDAPTKIPYTNAGAEGVRGTVQARLEKAVGVGFLSDDPAPVTTVPNVNEVPEEIRKAWKLPDAKFTARVAGAIHTVDITGYIGD